MYILYSGRGGSIMSVKKNKIDDDSDDLTRDLEDPISEPNISEINLNISQVKTGKLYICFFFHKLTDKYNFILYFIYFLIRFIFIKER